MIPNSLGCVEKVGGVFALAKNLKRKKNDARTALRGGENWKSSEQFSGLSNSNSIPAHEKLMYRPSETQQFDNNYTAFRREEPIIRQVAQPVSPQVVSRDIDNQRVQTPSFSQSYQQTPTFSQVSPRQGFPVNNVQASRVIVPQENNRVIPQFVH